MSENSNSFTPTPYDPSAPAHFTPTQGNYRELKPFRFWCQKVLPLVYDDSLSYYELLCKVVDYLNKTMEDVDTLHTDVDNLHTAYEELQSDYNTKYAGMTEWINQSYQALVDFVNTYFEELDVQDEINNKLDDMAQDGSLSALVAPYVPSVVEEWLDLHITNPDTVVIDDTLSIGGACADAKATGSKITLLNNIPDSIGELITVGNIRTNRSTNLGLTIREDRTAIYINSSVIAGKSVCAVDIYCKENGTVNIYKCKGMGYSSTTGNNYFSEEQIASFYGYIGWNRYFFKTPITFGYMESIGVKNSNVGRDDVSPYNGLVYADINNTSLTWHTNNANVFIIPYESNTLAKLLDGSFAKNRTLYDNKYKLQKTSRYDKTATPTGLTIRDNRTAIIMQPSLLLNKTIIKLEIYSSANGYADIYKCTGCNTQEYTETLIKSAPVVTGWNTIVLDEGISFSENESIGVKNKNLTLTDELNEGALYGTINGDTITWSNLSQATLSIIPYEIILSDNESYQYKDVKKVEVEDYTVYPLTPFSVNRTGIYVLNKCFIQKKAITGVKIYMYEANICSIYKGSNIGTDDFLETLIGNYSLNEGWNTIYFNEEIIINPNESIGSRCASIGRIENNVHNWTYANISGGTYTWTENGCFLFIPIEKILKPIKNYSGKKLSILGDSISTFLGYIPEGYYEYYYNGKFGMNVYDTWWSKILNSLDMNLLINNSFGGTKVSGDSVYAGAGDRCTSLDVNGVYPDVIIVFMGTNDFWGAVNIGTWDGKNPVPTSRNTFIEAYEIMLNKIRKKYTNAEIYCCNLPQYATTFNADEMQYIEGKYENDYNDALEFVVKKLGCKLIDLSSCGIDIHDASKFYGDYNPDEPNPHYGVHLNAVGHEYIYERILNTILYN